MGQIDARLVLHNELLLLLLMAGQSYNSYHMSKYSALFTSVNLLLGVGPLILPMPFFDAGIVLSIIWMIIICLLSYNSAMFIS